jgi:cytochrome P450
MWLWLKPRGLDTLFESSVPEDLKSYAAFVESCLTERTKKEEQLQKEGSNEDARKDFFHYLFRVKDPETGELGYPPGELFSESELLIVAGSDTTSTVFAAAFFYLVHNPQAQSKLTTEIRSTFESVDEIRNGKKLQSCIYLRAFIDESMRMNPPVTSELNREVLPGGLSVNGEFFAEGTNVGVSLYSIHHNEAYFPEPFAFRPERWIEGEGATAESVALATSAFAPFSIGARGCIGKNLAYMEMTIAIAKVVYRYDVRRVDQDTTGAGSPELGWGRRNKGEYQVNDAFVAAARHGPKVQFKARTH